ncbi:MAG: hypothetical protein KW788_00680 [Candidatus Doudnabacteria bacterium]|nr:hypothetical protein [Candidatus Doudnabacteria bacterium]
MSERLNIPEQEPAIKPSPETEGFLEQLQQDGEGRSSTTYTSKKVNLSESGSMVDAQNLERTQKATSAEGALETKALSEEDQKLVMTSWIKEIDAGTDDPYSAIEEQQRIIPGE